MSKTVQLPAYVYQKLTQPASKRKRKSTRKQKCTQGLIFKCRNALNDLINGIVLCLMILGVLWLGETFKPFHSFLYSVLNTLLSAFV